MTTQSKTQLEGIVSAQAKQLRRQEWLLRKLSEAAGLVVMGLDVKLDPDFARLLRGYVSGGLTERFRAEWEIDERIAQEP